MARRAWGLAAIALLAIAGAWLLFVGLPRWYGRSAGDELAAPDRARAAAGGTVRKINATLYYIAEDGLSLVGVPREVPFAEAVAEQARHVVEAQMGAAPDPLAPPVPAGTTIHSVFVTERGDAFVDVSGEARARHTGGALDEMLTVYAIVNALTVNLPAISRVQILIDGQEVDTLAGHVDLRHPLQKNLTWVKTEND